MSRIEEAFETELLANGPEALLEIAYLESFLRSKGHRLKDICGLPEHEARTLMKEACRYASARLAEVEARAHFKEEIHGVTQPP